MATLSGPFSNAGLITATGGTLNLDGTFNFGSAPTTWTNSGTISATNATVNLAGNETVAQIGTLLHDATVTLNYTAGTLDNTGGTLDASTASLLNLRLTGGTIAGGVLDVGAFGLTFNGDGRNTLQGVAVINGLTLANGNIVLANGSKVYADASQTGLGTISVTNGGLVFREAGPITVSQTIMLANSTLGFDNPGTTALVTIDAAGVVMGSGQLPDNIFGFSGPNTLDNHGTINSNIAGQNLAITPTGFTNSGLLEATGGGNLTAAGAEPGLEQYRHDPAQRRRAGHAERPVPEFRADHRHRRGAEP